MLQRLPHVLKFRLGRWDLTKVYFRLEDGALTETVFTQTAACGSHGLGGSRCSSSTSGGPANSAVAPPSHNTVCVSSQIGCRRTCGHCSSGLVSFGRNLTTNEIIGQVAAFAVDHEIQHVVFQGMGEPLDNPAVSQAASFLTSSYDKLTCSCDGVECSASHGASPSSPSVCLSTVGSSEGMLELAAIAPKTRLVLSVMPDNECLEPVQDLLRSTDEFAKRTGRSVALSYTMINGLDTETHIDDLLDHMSGRENTHVVQLVQYHESACGTSHARPSDPAAIRRCIEQLRRHGCRVGFGQYCEFPSELAAT